ncbi:hypothetical protein VTO73DRAFT_3572 [Trametes versicolor]
MDVSSEEKLDMVPENCPPREGSSAGPDWMSALLQRPVRTVGGGEKRTSPLAPRIQSGTLFVEIPRPVRVPPSPESSISPTSPRDTSPALSLSPGAPEMPSPTETTSPTETPSPADTPSPRRTPTPCIPLGIQANPPRAGAQAHVSSIGSPIPAEPTYPPPPLPPSCPVATMSQSRVPVRMTAEEPVLSQRAPGLTRSLPPPPRPAPPMRDRFVAPQRQEARADRTRPSQLPVPRTKSPRPPPPPPVELMRNQFMPPPRVADAFDGRVASQAGFQSLVITSPNQDFVPEYPIERKIIKTYSDGLWGVNEYSRWPQELVTGMWHVACIPRRGAYSLPDVLWRNLRPEEDWYEDRRAGVLSVGYLHPPIIEGLYTAAERAVAAFRSIPGLSSSRRALGDQLCMMLGQCVGRLSRLPAKPGIAVAVAAHVQRLCLELAGLKIYLEVVTPRIDAPRDFSQQILPVLGTFVNEGTAAQTCTRVRLPTWFLQPLTAHIKVWRVVRVQSPYDLSVQESQSHIYHHPSVRVGVMNLTGNWLATMIQGVSRQLCAIRPLSLPTSSSTEADEDAERDPKRPRAAAEVVASKTLRMPAAPSREVKTGETKKKPRARGGKKSKPRGTQAIAPPEADRAPATSSAASSSQPPAPPTPRPSLQFYPSPFVSLSEAWTRALSHVGSLPYPTKSTVYFFPPPFLLDTLSPDSPLPNNDVPPEAIRHDVKVRRYLHNLVRIRHFCRLRLFEATVSGHPLTIVEWREALWGEYRIREDPQVQGGEAEARRMKRKYEGKNAIARLFGGVGSMRVYSDADAPKLGSLEVTKDVAANDPRVRYHLLWEAHEINWRCEVLALDQVVVPRESWPDIDRWEREKEVSAVWGEISGVIGVLPNLTRDVDRFCWLSPSDSRWKRCLKPLKAFLELMSRWPDYPASLRGMPEEMDEWSNVDFEGAQAAAARFYTDTFVKHFARLPVVPFEFPMKYKL